MPLMLEGRKVGGFPVYAPRLPRRAEPRHADPVLGGVRQFAAVHGVTADGPSLAPLWSALRAAGLPFPGLAYAEWSDTLALGGVLAAVLANSPTLGEALAGLERFHPLLDRDEIALIRSPGIVAVTLRTTGGASDPDTVDAAFAMLARAGHRLAGVRPQHVHLRRAVPADPVFHRSALGSVSFGRSADRLVYRAAALAAPVAEADPALLDVVLPYAQRRMSARRPSWTVAVRSLLEETPDEAPSLAVVARSLTVGVRTLQLRLAEEGATFAAVSAGVRRDRAQSLLADQATSVSTIAIRVGFATPAAFVRAFRRWTGLTPSQYRRTHGTTAKR